MKQICAFKVAVEQVTENTFGNSVILRPKQRVTQFAVVKDMGFMAKQVYPDLNIGDTILCDWDSSRVVDGLNVLSVYEIHLKINKN